MKTLCFALLLSQNTQNLENAPPTHIQDLLKKKILYQIKQQNPDLQFYFDEATCNVLGSYDYVNESVEISSNDKSLALSLSYNDILEGRKLELSQLSQAIEAKNNVLLAGATQNSFDASASDSPTGSQLKRWLPWVVGAVGLSLGGWAVYNSLDRNESPSQPRSRRSR